MIEENQIQQCSVDNFQTRHTNYNTHKLQHPTHDSNHIKPEVRRSTQAYYDSELSKIQHNRSRGKSEESQASNKSGKNHKAFRQELTFLPNEEHQRQFFAYFVAVKQSNSGIFSHQRFILLDSNTKQLKYYSDIPQLPLKSIGQLKEPKEVIAVDQRVKVKEVGVGEMMVSSVGRGVKKEWHLTLGSRKMVKEFQLVLGQIREDKYLTLKQLKRTLGNTLESLYEHKIKKIDTPFISEIKQLQRKQHRTAEKDDSLRSSLKVSNSRQIDQVLELGNVLKKEEKEEKKVEIEDREMTGIVVEEKVNNNKGEQRVVERALQEIKLDNILSAAEQQLRHSGRSQHRQLTSPFTDPKLSQLQAILQRRKQVTSRQQLTNQQPPNQITQSRTITKQVPPNLPLLPHRTTNISKPKQDLTVPNPNQIKRPSSQVYESSEQYYRKSMLEERRQSYVATVKKRANKVDRHSHPRSQRVSKQSNRSAVRKQRECWLSGWLLARDRQQMAQIYSDFMETCVEYLLQLTETLQDWHLFHRSTSSKYTIDEGAIQYTYHMFLNDHLKDSTEIEEEQLQLQFEGSKHLLTSLKFNASSKLGLAIGLPLQCVVTLKGFKFYCRAKAMSKRITSGEEDVRNKYSSQIAQLQQIAKISLESCELVELLVDSREYLYFNKTPILPKVSSKGYLQSSFINKYVKEGPIANQLDIQHITEHLQNQILLRTTQRVQNSFLLSSTQLRLLLSEEGLNLTLVEDLLHGAIIASLDKAVSIYTSEQAAVSISKEVRYRSHCLLMGKYQGKNISTIVYDLFSKRLKQSESPLKWSYLITSLCQKLALNITIKHRMQTARIEDRGTSFWQSVAFNSKNFEISFVHSIDKYPFSFFSKDHPQVQQVLQSNTRNLQRETINLIDRFQPFSISELSQLTNQKQMGKINQLLAYANSPPSHSSSTQQTPLSPYYNLLCKPTAYIPTVNHLQSDLIGIKWLIKAKDYTSASIHLDEQLRRALIWTDGHPLLIELYSLASSFHKLLNNQIQSIASSLKAFQMSILCYGDSFFEHWETVLISAFQAANLHFHFQKYEQSLQLYESACTLLQKVDDASLKSSQIGPDFVSIYCQKLKISMVLCKMQQAKATATTNVGVLNKYKQLFVGRKDYITIIDQQLFQNCLLQLRCLQITRDYSTLIRRCGEYLAGLLETELPKVGHPISFSLSNYRKLKELTKYVWICIFTSQNYFDVLKQTSPQLQIQQKYIRQALKQIWSQNHHIYHYSNDQIYQHIVAAVNQSGQQQSGSRQGRKIKGSFYIGHILTALAELNQHRLKAPRCKLYDSGSTLNHLLFLQCLGHIMSFDFAISTIQPSYT